MQTDYGTVEIKMTAIFSVSYIIIGLESAV